MWPSKIKTQKYEDLGLKAFYLAQAGLERGWALALQPGSFSGSDGLLQINPGGGGWYSYNVIDGVGDKIISSMGFYVDGNGAIMAVRHLEMTVNVNFKTRTGWKERKAFNNPAEENYHIWFFQNR
jgi:hypothetical protein